MPSFLGAALSVLVTAQFCRMLLANNGSTPWIVASTAASAVLILTVPSSPFAGPWPVLGGSTISALVGSLCAQVIPEPSMACGAATALSLITMSLLRCMHPPGAAAAVLASSTGVHWTFAIFPVLCNCLVLVAVAGAFNSLAGRWRLSLARVAQAGKRKRLLVMATGEVSVRALAAGSGDAGLSGSDTGAISYPRHLGVLRCEDIMRREPVAVEPHESLLQCWTIMQVEAVHALPVIDQSRRVLGIVTTSDFRIRNASTKTRCSPDHPGGCDFGERPCVVRDIMTPEARVVEAKATLTDLTGLFGRERVRQLPVIDEDRKLVGMISQSDVLAAMHHAMSPQ